MTPLLCFEGVSKRFGGTQAVDDVTLEVQAGEVLALLGENGAGKSTLIKLLAGIYPADAGRMLVDGKPEEDWRSRDPLRQPVAFIHQDLGLVEWMTVAENVAIGMGYPRLFGWKHGLVDWRAADAIARRVLERVGCDIDPGRRVFSLTRAEKSLLAIGRALEVKARLLVLDEPSASLPATDVNRLFDVLRDLRRQGVGMIYVSHRLDEVMQLSDRAAVMRDGKLVGVRRTAESSEAGLVELIVGQALADDERAAAPIPRGDARPLLALQGAVAGNAGPVDLALHPGEILGLVGLRGAGQDAIGRALFGCEPLVTGTLEAAGRRCELKNPAQAIAAGIGYTAGERLEQNLAGSMSVQENLFPNPRLHGERGLDASRRRRELKRAEALAERFDINPRAPQAIVQQLSGGNQQKVVLARWEALALPVQVLEEPTAGVDVGAKRQIYALLRRRAAEGAGLVVVSTDYEEVATVCTRVLVFRAGRIAAELHGADITIARLLALSAGSAGDEREAA
ncbi:ribose transport system ATP-binding protein [Variovorax sp. HW608]|uniref:sugar ABC transporter ATP-binding protein n=1 Tax=Variovorax sp. HW608 TaxID=1034889 RepID=UPI00081FF71C|nr:sugar ABC transporter ATP-binding protein [Variovorax sp. HW608]SCK16502.1 ribose transport system ATP-binding protein [Variovorax sp. HW608]